MRTARITVDSDSGGTNGNMLFATGGTTERVRITSAGLVGIGTNNPGGTLHLDASGGATVRLSRLSTNNSKYIQLEHDGSNGSNKY